jgi:hypothetical protein
MLCNVQCQYLSSEVANMWTWFRRSSYTTCEQNIEVSSEALLFVDIAIWYLHLPHILRFSIKHTYIAEWTFRAKALAACNQVYKRPACNWYCYLLLIHLPHILRFSIKHTYISGESKLLNNWTNFPLKSK